VLVFPAPPETDRERVELQESWEHRDSAPKGFGCRYHAEETGQKARACSRILLAQGLIASLTTLTTSISSDDFSSTQALAKCATFLHAVQTD